MATIVRGTVPAAEFALYETLASVGSVEFEAERIIESGEETVMPLIWARGADSETLEAAIDTDSSVEEYSQLASFEDEHLYRMEWGEGVSLALQMLANSKATIMDAYGHGGQWSLRVLYPSRDSFSTTMDFCDEEGLTFDVTAIREMEGEPTGRYGLTERQYETLTTAVERGYYAIPREITAQDLAEELDVSHQALSELLRRGHEALIEDTLLIGAGATDEDGDGR